MAPEANSAAIWWLPDLPRGASAGGPTRALVGGSVAATGWIGLTVAFGDFTHHRICLLRPVAQAPPSWAVLRARGHGTSRPARPHPARRRTAARERDGDEVAEDALACELGPRPRPRDDHLSHRLDAADDRIQDASDGGQRIDVRKDGGLDACDHASRTTRPGRLERHDLLDPSSDRTRCVDLRSSDADDPAPSDVLGRELLLEHERCENQDRKSVV